MKPLIVLLLSFCLAVIGTKIFLHKYDFALSMRIGMSVMLIFTAFAHFAFSKGMTMMIPDFIPFKKGMVYGTGIFEIIAAIGLQITGVRSMTGWLLIIFFVLMLPANINAARKHIDYQKGNYEGMGLKYLWFRVPLQIVFILWTLFSL